ncbi:Uma2 family endonuclease [Deinococcus cavernae]|uniref:Uma2 family endonuclease n=1 Tax=Deinococcus cavernae TaxID=2320857 RepID=A0A418V716_9DEIO|nr:Uma2 family endonuclease [Deinococcus cavernae]RJF71872.1 Uma2 family endonuclease [Deinococcus cavernae]
MTDPAFRNRKMTEEEYLRFLAESEVRYEYVDGFVYAQAGATNAHNLIARNIYALLRPATKSKGCNTYQNDMRLRLVSPHVSKPLHYFPDVMVTCEALSNDAMSVTQPCLIVEVLSQSTRSTDKSYKAERYRELPNLQAYLMVDSLSRSAALYRRMGDEGAYEIVGETVELLCPEVTLTMRDIYDGVNS